MNIVFYISSAIAVLAAIMVVTRTSAVHALLYLVVSMLAISLVFFVLGAPLIAALEVVVYAGAIMVLFVFVVMLLNLGSQATEQERLWLQPRVWRGPSFLAALLLILLGYALRETHTVIPSVPMLEPAAIGQSLFGPYMLAVELASILLLAGLVGAFSIARRDVLTRKERSS